MGTLIAIKKNPIPSPDTTSLGHDNIEERRQQTAEDASRKQTTNTQKLEEIDFERFSLVDEINETMTLEKVLPEGTFERLGHIGAYVINPPDAESEQAVRAILARNYSVFSNKEIPISMIPGPEERSPYYSYRAKPQWPEECGISLAHKNGITGREVMVGVLDSGCDVDHEQFHHKDEIEFLCPTNRVNIRNPPKQRGFDIDPKGHGTAVCGLIAGNTLGVAPDVEPFVASVTHDNRTSTDIQRIVVGLEWLLSRFSAKENQHKPAIINLSLGIYPEALANAGISDFAESLQAIIDKLAWAGVLLIAAVGNNGPGQVCMPASFQNVLSVGAVDFEHQPPEWSGGMTDGKLTNPNLVGYGVKVQSCIPRGRKGKNDHRYDIKLGTSFAAPYVTGIAALYWAESLKLQLHNNTTEEHHLSSSEIWRILEATALSLNSLSHPIGKGLARFVPYEKRQGNTNGK